MASGCAETSTAMASAVRCPSPSTDAMSSRAATSSTRDCQNAEPIWISRNGGGVTLLGMFCSQAANFISFAKRRTAPECFCNGIAKLRYSRLVGAKTCFMAIIRDMAAGFPYRCIKLASSALQVRRRRRQLDAMLDRAVVSLPTPCWRRHVLRRRLPHRIAAGRLSGCHAAGCFPARSGRRCVR